MKNSTVLIVEDDNAVRNLISTTLKVNNYKYITSSDGYSAIDIIIKQKPDVVLLDLGLPDMDGLDVIKNIRGWSNIPIIVISARSEDNDKIVALDSGADDYLTKPFSVEELLARLRVIQRRISSSNFGIINESSFENGLLYIDYAKCLVRVGDNEIRLTPIEFKLLCLLSKNVGKVLTHKFILKNVWGSDWENDVSSLRVFMTTLRKKIEIDESMKNIIQTRIGIGYVMIKI